MDKNRSSAPPIRDVFWHLTLAFLRALLTVLFRIEVTGAKNIPITGSYILASNHASYADPPIVAVAAHPRVISFMAKASLFKVPVLGPTITKLHAFPVNREASDRAAIKTALSRLEEGYLLGIFPQGTRFDDGSLEFSEGVAFLSEKSGAPVIPVAIHGSGRIWRGGWFPIRFQKLRVTVGEPILYPQVEQGQAIATRKAFTQAVRSEVARMLQEGGSR